MSTIILTTGQPGSGKSYSRVRWLIQDYLVNSTGIYITNIPINSETISSTFSDSEYILNRLKVIPFDVLKEWEQLSRCGRRSRRGNCTRCSGRSRRGDCTRCSGRSRQEDPR